MRGLLMKDLELIKINMKMYLAVFLIGIIYLVAQENGSTFFVAYAIFVSIGVSVGTISYVGYHHPQKQADNTDQYCKTKAEQIL